MLLIAKYSEYNIRKRDRWIKGGISVKEVLRYINDTSRKQKLFPLKDFYLELSLFTHPTPYSQQPFLISKNLKITEENMRKLIENYLINSVYTIDLLFIIMVMYLHALNILHNKVRRWYLGYYEDPLGVEETIRKLKKDIKNIKERYFQLMIESGVDKESLKRLKKVIYAYRLNWK